MGYTRANYCTRELQLTGLDLQSWFVRILGLSNQVHTLLQWVLRNLSAELLGPTASCANAGECCGELEPSCTGDLDELLFGRLDR